MRYVSVSIHGRIEEYSKIAYLKAEEGQEFGSVPVLWLEELE